MQTCSPRPPQRGAGDRTHPGTASLFPPEGGGGKGQQASFRGMGQKGSCRRKKCLGGVWKARLGFGPRRGRDAAGQTDRGQSLLLWDPRGPRTHPVCTADLSPLTCRVCPRTVQTCLSLRTPRLPATRSQRLLSFCSVPPTSTGTPAPEANLPPNTRTQSPPVLGHFVASTPSAPVSSSRALVAETFPASP